MLFRDHPLMSGYGIQSWATILILSKGPESSLLTVEIGILTLILLTNIPSTPRCFLYMYHEESSYLGCIFVADVTFFCQIVKIFEDCLNRPISEIGNIDLTYTL